MNLNIRFTCLNGWLISVQFGHLTAVNFVFVALSVTNRGGNSGQQCGYVFIQFDLGEVL